MNLQEIYELEDVDFYDSMTSNSGHWTSNNGAILNINEYSRDGWRFGQSSQYTHMVCDYIPSYPFECSFEVTEHGTNYDNGIFVNDNALLNILHGNNTIQIRTSSWNTYNVSVLGKWKIKCYSDKFQVYKEDTFIGERGYDSTQTPKIQLEAGYQTTRFIQIRNFIIKAL